MSNRKIRVGGRTKQKAKIDLFGRALEMPAACAVAGPHITLLSNREASVEGCHGVIEYEDTRVKLNVGSGTLTFCGRQLSIAALGCEGVTIRGYIQSLEFCM